MGLKKRLMRVYYGLDTWQEFLLFSFGKITKSSVKYTEFFCNEHSRCLAKKYVADNCIKIKDVKLPLLSKEREVSFFTSIFEDTFASYVSFNDCYDEDTFDKVDNFLMEGFYGLVNDKISVTVEPGDVVIDAGSWIGDFAAYASVKGATVYAFEPSEENYQYLLKTAELNKNIIPVKKGLSNEIASTHIFKNITGNSGSDSLMNKSSDDTFQEAVDTVETITLDEFVRENNLERVDFIKCDIEGFERNMLEGAQETLKKFAPKLALCTYHLPDDPEVMAKLIKQANPAYNIVQKRCKLFASVPK